MVIYIYVLYDKKSQEKYRYCGQSNSEERIKAHINEAKNEHKCYRCYWIRKVEYQIDYKIIETCYSDKEANDREIYWIAELKKQGHELTNMTEGGDGTRGYHPTPEVIEKRAAKRRGIKQSPETIAKRIAKTRGMKRSIDFCKMMSELKTGKKQNPETCFRRNAKLRGKPKPIGFGEKISKIMKGKPKSKEHREKISKSLKGKMPSPQLFAASKKARTGMKFSKEWCEKIGKSNSIALKLYYEKKRLKINENQDNNGKSGIHLDSSTCIEDRDSLKSISSKTPPS